MTSWLIVNPCVEIFINLEDNLALQTVGSTRVRSDIRDQSSTTAADFYSHCCDKVTRNLPEPRSRVRRSQHKKLITATTKLFTAKRAFQPKNVGITEKLPRNQREI